MGTTAYEFCLSCTNFELARTRKLTSEAATKRFHLWLEEAIQQVQEVIRR